MIVSTEDLPVMGFALRSQALDQAAPLGIAQRAQSDLVVFLASDLAANVTGADFAIDGGLIPTW
jgi:hypothetical protein